MTSSVKKRILNEKECYSCHKFKPLTHFSKNRRKRDGLSHECKECAKKRLKRYKKIWAFERQKRKKISKEKKCIKCHQIKSISEFSRSMTHKYGFMNKCKTCSIQDSKTYHVIWIKERLQRSKSPTVKKCKVCHKIKPTSQFYTTLHLKDGLYNICKDCAVKYSQELKQRWKEKRSKQTQPPHTEKICIKCHRILPLTCFYTVTNIKDGFDNTCQDCYAERHKEYSLRWMEERQLNLDPLTEKTCSRCKQILTISEFYPDDNNKDGYSEYCKECNRQLRLTYMNKWEKERTKKPSVLKTKECSFCHKILPLTQFYPNRRYKKGYSPLCIACENQRSKQYMQQWVEERKTIPTEKQCHSCKRVLPANQFRRNKRKKDGLDYVCRECSKVLRTEYSNRWSKERAARNTDFTLFPSFDKTCSVCQRTLPLSLFYTSEGTKDGYKSSCKECDLKRMKIYLEKQKVRPKIIPDEKVCSVCKQRLPASAFNNSHHRPDGLDIYCKACHNKKQREYFSSPAVRKRMKEWNKAYRQKPEVRAKTRKRARAYAQRPYARVKRIEYNKKHRALPEVQRQRQQYSKEYYLRKKKLKEQRLQEKNKKRN